jgi:hypothetical protein
MMSTTSKELKSFWTQQIKLFPEIKMNQNKLTHHPTISDMHDWSIDRKDYSNSCKANSWLENPDPSFYSEKLRFKNKPKSSIKWKITSNYRIIAM